MTRLSDLPDEVLVLLLQHVPIKDRLGSCSLVSKRLHAAAVAATEQLSLTAAEPARAGSVLNWISHYGQHLTTLILDKFAHPIRRLPCQHLQRLQLYNCRVQLEAAEDGQPGVIQGCTKLTVLVLHGELLDTPEGAVLDGLSKLVHLRHLMLQSSTDRDVVGGLSVATLPRLQQLTCLGVQRFNRANLLQLSGLPSLQGLHVWAGDEAVGPISVDGLMFPASLKTLLLSSTVEAGILSLVSTGLQHLEIDCDVKGPSEGHGFPLSFLTRLQHLTWLSLTENSGIAWPPAGPAYSALTASSSLVYLEMYGAHLPQGIWSHMFPSAHRMPQLTSLILGCHTKRHHDDGQGASLWGAADLSSLVCWCPALCHIDTMCLHPGSHISQLHRLVALTSLNMYYPSLMQHGPESFAACASGLAALTQLRQLDVKQNDNGQRVKTASLLPLTSLTALTWLCVRLNDYDDGGDSDDSDGNHSHEVYGGPELDLHATQDGSAPDVWLQLLERCAADPRCQPAALRSLAEQLAEQRALTLQQGQRLWTQEQRLSMQEQLNVQQGQSLWMQGQLLGMQDQLIVAQHQQIAGLHRQLQELRTAVQELLPARRRPSHQY